ncbi:hypothetical protein VTN00DRAFT_2028 [Thermoascus crustaceus]|uniref:uncharacterized protein n=1 Tax=Thermoascus crustaceus TaxID=5088 RepID=UPI0037438650
MAPNRRHTQGCGTWDNLWKHVRRSASINRRRRYQRKLSELDVHIHAFVCEQRTQRSGKGYMDINATTSRSIAVQSYTVVVKQLYVSCYAGNGP